MKHGVKTFEYSKDLRRLMVENCHISAEDILQRVSAEGRLQIVIPKVLTADILTLAHEEPLPGHRGFEKMLRRTVERFWWPNIREDVVNYTKSCTRCAERMPENRQARAPLGNRCQAKKPFQIIEMNTKGPLPMSDNNIQYILVIQDTFSRYVELSPLSRQTTDEVCSRICQWIGRYGIPVSIHSDHWSCFTSQFCGIL